MCLDLAVEEAEEEFMRLAHQLITFPEHGQRLEQLRLPHEQIGAEVLHAVVEAPQLVVQLLVLLLVLLAEAKSDQQRVDDGADGTLKVPLDKMHLDNKHL